MSLQSRYQKTTCGSFFIGLRCYKKNLASIFNKIIMAPLHRDDLVEKPVYDSNTMTILNKKTITTRLLLCMLFFTWPCCAQSSSHKPQYRSDLRLSHTKAFSYIIHLDQSLWQKIRMFHRLKRGLCHGYAKTLLHHPSMNPFDFINTTPFFQKTFKYQLQEEKRAKEKEKEKEKVRIIYKLTKPTVPAFMIALQQYPQPHILRQLGKRKNHSLFLHPEKRIIYNNEKGLFTFASLEDLAHFCLRKRWVKFCGEDSSSS